MSLIIGFGHQTGVGKDEAAKILVERFKNDLHMLRWKFASSIKDFSYRLFGRYGLMPGDCYEGSPEARTKRKVPLPVIEKTPEEIWIHVGTAMREIYEPIWADEAMEKVRHSDRRVYLFTDVRSMPEARAIREAGGYLVKVTKPGNRVLKLDTLIPDDFEWDATIRNDGSLEYLAKLAEECFRGFLHMAGIAQPL